MEDDSVPKSHVATEYDLAYHNDEVFEHYEDVVLEKHYSHIHQLIAMESHSGPRRPEHKVGQNCDECNRQDLQRQPNCEKPHP